MPYAGFCQGCVNEKGIGLACGQNPLTFCDKHLLAMYKSIIAYGVLFFPDSKMPEKDLASCKEGYLAEIKLRGLQVSI